MEPHDTTHQRILAAIDVTEALLQAQLDEICRAPSFVRLRRSWHGLHLLVSLTETDGSLVEIRVVQATKHELRDDFLANPAVRQNWMFRTIYEMIFHQESWNLQSFDAPFSLLIADHGFDVIDSDDLLLLERFSGVAALAHASFVAAVSPRMLEALPVLDGDARCVAWQSLRDRDESRFLCLTVPHGTWIVGCLIARAFARDGWSPRLIDEEGGVAIDDASAVDIWLSDAQLIDLGRYGLLPLTTTADGGGIAAFSVGTVHRPMVFEDAMASADAQIAASLPCILSVARLVHTIKVQIRNKQLVFVERSDVVSWLNRWLARYVSRGDGQAPLVEARLTIEMDLANYQVFPVTIDLWPRLDDSPISRPLRVVTEAYNSRQ